MHGNLNHIGLYVYNVEHTYNKHYTVRNGWGDYVRPVAMLVAHRFTGLSMHDIARYFKCTTSAVSLAIGRQLEYEETGNPSFLQHYNQLLDLYIQSTKFYIRKRKFITRPKL